MEARQVSSFKTKKGGFSYSELTVTRKATGSKSRKKKTIV